MGEGELDTSEPISSKPILQGRVEYNKPQSDGIWHKSWDVLKGVGHVVKEALPYVARAAEGFTASPSSYLPSSNPLLPMDTGIVLTNPTERASRRRSLKAQPIAEYSVKPIARTALSRLEQPTLPKQSSRPDWQQLQARTTRILDSLASAKGLPSYEQFHQQHGVPFQNQPRQSKRRVQPFNPPPSSTLEFIREDEQQIRYDLAQAKKPVSLAEQRARQQADLVAQQQEEARQAAIQEQQNREYQIRKHQSKAAQLPASFYRDRIEGPVNITELVLDGKVPTDDKLAQLFHTLEAESIKAENPLDRVQAERNWNLAIEYLATNMATGSWANLSKDDYVIIGNQAYGKSEAYPAALRELNHFRQTGEHLPLKYPIHPPNSSRDIKGYPDITEKLSKELDTITKETALTLHASGKAGVYNLFAKNYS
jgi:hypothetical protein